MATIKRADTETIKTKVLHREEKGDNAESG